MLLRPSWPKHLFSVSGESARDALRKYSSGSVHDSIWSAVAAGLALESLLKYVAVTRNPLLIAERTRNSLRTQLLLAGIEDAGISTSQVRTIGASESAALVLELHKNLVPPAVFDQVFSVRNSAAHLGIVNPDELALSMQNMTVAVDKLLGALDKNKTRYWSEDLLPVVEQMLDERATALDRWLEAKLAQARAFFEQLTGELNESDKTTVVRILTAQAEWQVDDEDILAQACPACENDGYLELYIEEIEPSDPEIVCGDFREAIRRGYPDHFKCTVCGLDLDASECDRVSIIPSEFEMASLERNAFELAMFEDRKNMLLAKQSAAAGRSSS